MKKNKLHSFLRSPVEFYNTLFWWGGGVYILSNPSLFLLTPLFAKGVAAACFGMGAVRWTQALKIRRWQRGLLHTPHYELSTIQVPCDRSLFFLGRGFEWTAEHRARLHHLEHQYAHFIKVPAWRLKLKIRNQQRPESTLAKIANVPPFNRFFPSDLGGKPWLHAIGQADEADIFLPQKNRVGHILVLGTTRVGKTRLMSILVNQDIRNGGAVLVLDPKGDLDLLKDMYEACRAAGRLSDFRILHAGMPEVSAKYNPISCFTDISEVASRVTSGLSAEGEGKTFKDFAWRFLNVTARALNDMNEAISYKTIAFFVVRPKQLLMRYADVLLSTQDPNYHDKINTILEKQQEKMSKKKNDTPFQHADAVRMYVAELIEENIKTGRQGVLGALSLVELFEAASMPDDYYSKITANLSPLFDKINKTSAGDIFSWSHPLGLPVISLTEVMERKQVCYMGLDAMSNPAMSEAIARAVVADLASIVGKNYKEDSAQKRVLALHMDELNNMVDEPLIQLLNKAGGAGVQITAYTQTVNDLKAAFGSNANKPEMMLGNFNTLIMLRVANSDTAEFFTQTLPDVRIAETSTSTQSSGHAFAAGIDHFKTSESESLQSVVVPLIESSDVLSLPKGQAFVRTDGGKIYKIRIPLPSPNEGTDKSVAFILSEVNLCEAH